MENAQVITSPERDQNIESQTPQQQFAERFKHFLSRTNTQYTRTDLNYLPARGIENRLLDNLLDFWGLLFRLKQSVIT